MTKKLNPSKQFKELMKYVAEGDSDNAGYFYKQLQEQGLKLEIDRDDRVEFKADSGEYTQLTQISKLKLGGEVVYKWESVYFGYYGGMGACWFVEQDTDGLDLEVEKLLKACGIALSAPNVPKPSPDEEES
jgi:hypothetical protein